MALDLILIRLIVLYRIVSCVYEPIIRFVFDLVWVIELRCLLVV